MPVTLVCLYRRPEGGEEALATFLARYEADHAPLVRATPGLRSFDVLRVAKAFGESDLAMVALMRFDDRAALDEALASEPMREAARNLREIAPGLATLFVAEEAPALGGLGDAGAARGSVSEAGIDVP